MLFLQLGFRGTGVSSNRGPVVSGNMLLAGCLTLLMVGFPRLLKVMVWRKWQPGHTPDPSQRGQLDHRL